MELALCCKILHPVLVKLLLLILLFFPFGSSAQGTTHIDESYYVTLAGDTIRGILWFQNMTRAQDSIKFQDKEGNVNTFYPGEIKGFGLHVLSVRDRLSISKWEQPSPAEAGRARQQGFKGWHREGERFVRFDVGGIWEISFPDDTKLQLDFESVPLGEGVSLFLRRSAGSGKDGLKVFQYRYDYLAHQRGGGQVQSTAILLLAVKSDSLIPSVDGEHFHEWISRVVSDHPLLSTLVRNKVLNQTNLVVKEYNYWLAMGKPQADTSALVRGIVDADRFFGRKTKVPTQTITVSGKTVDNSFSGQHFKIVVPFPCSFCNSDDYINGYMMRAIAKKRKNLRNTLLKFRL